LAIKSEADISKMRVLIAAPRKSGSALLRCLLASAYGLQTAGSRDAPDGVDLTAVVAWLAEIPDQCVVSTGFAHSSELAAAAARLEIALVGVLRHPFDLFVSNYDVAQQRATRGKDKHVDPGPWSQLSGRTFEDPELVAYARDGFAEEIAWLQNWQQNGAPIVRYEQLEAEPAVALGELAKRLGDLDDAGIVRAVEMCPRDGLVVSRPFRGRRMAELPSGAWRERLPVALHTTLREQYAEDIERLGYEVV
jgi:hypothetical protein